MGMLMRLDALPPCAAGVAGHLPTRLVIEAIGWGGDVQVVPWLIQQMADLRQARVAGEAFSLLTGANLALDEDESLPWPNGAKVQAWWEANRSRLPTGTRCFMGAAADQAQCQHVLRTGGQRQRAVAALLLVLMRPGSMLFNTAAPAPRQQRLLGLRVRVT